MTSTLNTIESTVKQERALSFTELKEKTGLSNGVLQHHIHNSEDIMKKRGAVLYKGVCEECQFQEACEAKCIQKELRKPQTAKVLKLLNSGLSQANIARELDLTRATVHYHVEKLRDMELTEV